MQQKNQPTLAKIKVPEKEIRQGNTTRLTVIPDANETVSNESLASKPSQENNIVFKESSLRTMSKLQKESVTLEAKSAPPQAELTELEAVNLQMS